MDTDATVQLGERWAGGVPLWFWALAGLGLAWNGFGLFQFFNAVTATRESLIAMGMTQVQARALVSYPLWMTAGFAFGTIGGFLGSVLLILRRRGAVPVLIASLAGYCVLYLGDITEGIFAALGLGQVVILSLVVAIAVGLLALARYARRAGILN